VHHSGCGQRIRPDGVDWPLAIGQPSGSNSHGYAPDSIRGRGWSCLPPSFELGRVRFGSPGELSIRTATSIGVGNVASLVPGGCSVSPETRRLFPAVHRWEVFVSSSDGWSTSSIRQRRTSITLVHRQPGHLIPQQLVRRMWPTLDPRQAICTHSSPHAARALRWAVRGKGHLDPGRAIDSSPTVVKNTVYVGADNGDLYSINGNLTSSP